jgi:hypothetical protein
VARSSGDASFPGIHVSQQCWHDQDCWLYQARWQTFKPGNLALLVALADLACVSASGGRLPWSELTEYIGDAPKPGLPYLPGSVFCAVPNERRLP